MPELSAAQIVGRWRENERGLGSQDNDRGGCSRNHRGSVDSEVVTMIDDILTAYLVGVFIGFVVSMIICAVIWLICR